MKKSIVCALAVLAFMAVVSPASASLVSFTDTTQLDNTGASAPDAYAVRFGAYETDALTVNGITFHGWNFSPNPGSPWPDSTLPNNGIRATLVNQGGANGFNDVNVHMTGPDAANMDTIIGNWRYFGWDVTFNGLTPGQSYKYQMVGADMGGWTGHGAANFSLSIVGNGTTLASDLDQKLGTGNYLYTTTFVANTDTVTIQMRNSSNLSWYAAASALSVTPCAAPEPATMTLLTLGGLGALIRRRK